MVSAISAKLKAAHRCGAFSQSTAWAPMNPVAAPNRDVQMGRVPDLDGEHMAAGSARRADVRNGFGQVGPESGAAEGMRPLSLGPR